MPRSPTIRTYTQSACRQAIGHSLCLRLTQPERLWSDENRRSGTHPKSILRRHSNRVSLSTIGVRAAQKKKKPVREGWPLEQPAPAGHQRPGVSFLFSLFFLLQQFDAQTPTFPLFCRSESWWLQEARAASTGQLSINQSTPVHLGCGLSSMERPEVAAKLFTAIAIKWGAGGRPLPTLTAGGGKPSLSQVEIAGTAPTIGRPLRNWTERPGIGGALGRQAFPLGLLRPDGERGRGEGLTPSSSFSRIRHVFQARNQPMCTGSCPSPPERNTKKKEVRDARLNLATRQPARFGVSNAMEHAWLAQTRPGAQIDISLVCHRSADEQEEQ